LTWCHDGESQQTTEKSLHNLLGEKKLHNPPQDIKGWLPRLYSP